jgi:hypothetical protein
MRAVHDRSAADERRGPWRAELELVLVLVLVLVRTTDGWHLWDQGQGWTRRARSAPSPSGSRSAIATQT